MNPVIIIPTFVSARKRVEAGPVLTTYDHTTPMSQEGQLPRCLDSLRVVRGLGQIIVLVISEPAIENQAVNKIHRIAEQFPDLHISVIGAPEMSTVTQRLEQMNVSCKKQVSLSGYGAARNAGLVVARALDFDAVVFIDDDVVVDDPDFLEKAMYGLGKLTRRGIPILAKTGFYYNAEGSYLAGHEARWYDRYWDLPECFNKWISHAMQGPRLSRSNHVCGGCMALHKEAFSRVAFDPWIARGEDLDYMINLRTYGSDIWFDNQWYMRHLPPKESNLSEGLRFRQDIFRWLYEFRKVEYGRTQIDLQPVKPQSLQPYPGPFLEPGVHKRIKRTAWMRSLGRPDGKGYRRAAKAATGDAARYAEANCNKYFEFQFKWPTIMARIENDSILQASLTMHNKASAASDMHGMGVDAGMGIGADMPDARMSATSAQRQVYPPRPHIDPGCTTEIRLNMGDFE